VNGPFDAPKPGPQRDADDLRLFEPGKAGKSLQDLAVGLSQPDRRLLQVRWVPHDAGQCNPDVELGGERMAQCGIWNQIRLWYVKGDA